MKSVAFFLFSLSLAGSAWGAVSWSVSQNHLCMISEAEGQSSGSRVICWNKSGEEMPVPDLKNPRAVATGYHLGGIIGDYSCALTDDGVTCWGEQSQRLNRFFSGIENPMQISAGFADICVGYEAGVRCFGSPEVPWTEISTKNLIPMNGVKALSVGAYYACAISLDGKLKCWGGVHSTYLPLLSEPQASRLPELDKAMHFHAPEFKAPTSLSVGLTHACVLEYEIPYCWGLEDEGAIQFPKGREFTEIQAGVYQTCGISRGETFCWGRGDALLDGFRAELKTAPVSLRLTPEGFGPFRNFCFSDDVKILCYGKIGNGGALSIDHSAYGYGLSNFEIELERITYFVYRSRKPFLQRMAKYVRRELQCQPDDKDCWHARGLVLLGLKPYLEGIQSEYFIQQVLSRYLSVRQAVEHRLGISRLRDFGSSPKTVQASLELLASAGLAIAAPNETVLSHLGDWQASLGQSIALGKPTPEFLLHSSALQPFWEQLSTDEPTAGLGELIQAQLQYLKSIAQ